MSGFLNSRELQAYEDNGFVFPIDVLSEAEALQHHERLVEVEARHGPMHYRVKPYLIFRSAWEIATHVCLLDAVESVLGPDILLWDCGYIIKEPSSEGYVSWHQDLTYWGLEMGSDDHQVTAWIALTPATTNNGCMRFVSGSHRDGKFDHEDTYDDKNILHRGQAIRDDFDETWITHVELSPGQASVHHGRTVHSSSPNTSNVRRVALSVQYVRPSVRQVVGYEESATLVRGQDRFGHFRSEPPCETDFAPENVAFQQEMERRKRQVYDTA